MEFFKQQLSLLERILNEIAIKKKAEANKTKSLKSLILKDLQNIRYFENLASLTYEEKKSVILLKPENGWLPKNSQIESMSKILFLEEDTDGKKEMIDGIRISYLELDSDSGLYVEQDITVYSYILKSKAPILFEIINSTSPSIFWPVYEPIFWPVYEPTETFDNLEEKEIKTNQFQISYQYSRIEPRGVGHIAIESFPSMKSYLEALIPRLEASNWRNLEDLEEEKKEIILDILLDLPKPEKNSIPIRISTFLTEKEKIAFKIIQKQTNFLKNTIEKLSLDLEEVLTPASGGFAILGIAGLLELPISDLFIYLANLDEMKLLLLKNPDLATQFSNLIKLGGEETPEHLKAALLSTDISYLPGLQEYYPPSNSWSYSSYLYFFGTCMFTAFIAYGIYYSIKTGYPSNSVVNK
jgi:hypothetical protein